MLYFLKSKKNTVLIFLFFLLLSIVATYPLVIKFNTHFYGFHGDTSGGLWNGWWVRYANEHNLNAQKTDLISAPFGVDYSYIPTQFIHETLYKQLYLIMNEVVYWNFFIFLSFPLSAITMYFLVHYITRNKLSSMIAGIIYAFCPYHFFHSYQHPKLAAIHWLPLYILCLIKLVSSNNYDWKKIRVLKYPLLCAFTYWIILNENFYYGYFLAIFTTVFIISYYGYYTLKKKKFIFNIDIITIALTTIFLTILFILPFNYDLIQTYLFHPLKNFFAPSEQLTAKSFRDFSELTLYSARIHEYFIPSIDHPIWGKYIYDFLKNHLHGSNFFENTIYLGSIPILLAGVGLISCWKERKENDNYQDPDKHKTMSNIKTWAFVFALTGLVMIIFSGPPNPTFFGIQVYLPSYFLHKIFSMFRVYARFGILVILCVSVLSGIGVFSIIKKISSNNQKILIATALIALIMLDFANLPPYKVTQATQTPEVYNWLKKQDGDLLIAEYPMVNEIEVRQYIYQFYQREHEKKMVNGARLNKIGEDFRNRLYDLNDPETAGILAYFKTKYVFVHKDIYKEGRLPKVLQKYYDPNYIAVYPIEYNSGNVPDLSNRIGFQFVKDFADTTVYEVTAKPQQFISLYGENIGNSENWGDGHIWRWMENNGKIKIVNTSEEEKSVSIEFDAVSFSRDRHLSISVNEHDVKKFKIVTPKEKYTINNVKLKSGYNNMVLDSPDGTDNIDKILHTGDVRDVSIAFTHFRIIENDKNGEY